MCLVCSFVKPRTPVAKNMVVVSRVFAFFFSSTKDVFQCLIALFFVVKGVFFCCVRIHQDQGFSMSKFAAMARRTLSIFLVVLRLRGGMQVFVKMLASTTQTIGVNPAALAVWVATQAFFFGDGWSEPSGVSRLGANE